MITLFNSGAEMNILLYLVVLNLGLAIQLNILVKMKGAGAQRSLFIGYVPDVPVYMGDIVIRQSFFILE